MLGEMVTVHVTHPLGTMSRLNKGLVRGQGGQEAYLFDVQKPVRVFTGRVIALLTRPGDKTVIWVVAHRDTVAYEPKIRRAVAACETGRGFRLKCLYEKSCGAVLYTEVGGVRHYLLVRNRSGNYGFPKGHVENVENERETALREIREETGLSKVTFMGGFRRTSRYTMRGSISKEVVLFLAWFDHCLPIQPAYEITKTRLLPYEDALKSIHFYYIRRIQRISVTAYICKYCK